MNTSAERYLIDGCGRCPLGGTPDCKVYHWAGELSLLRNILLASGLYEDCKWGAPCYTYEGHNVLMISALKNYCCISFFKGCLLKDKHQLLEKPGPNSHAVRLIKITDIKDIKSNINHIQDYIQESIEIEKSGMAIPPNHNKETMPEELIEALENDPILKDAFESLTPGRQRGYIIFISQAKQSQTRQNRIEKCTPMILSGQGMHDNYSRK